MTKRTKKVLFGAGLACTGAAIGLLANTYWLSKGFNILAVIVAVTGSLILYSATKMETA